MFFAGTGAAVANEVTGGTVTHVGVALTFGLVVMAAIYAVADVSGAHLNPTVTAGFWASRRLPGRIAVPYVAAQTAGALLASGLLRALFPTSLSLGATQPLGGDVVQSLVVEVVLTALLMFVILSVAVGSKEKGIMAGAAIGATVGLEALFAGPISGASMNPARSLAPALASGDLTALWVYVVAPLVGAAVAVALYAGVHGRPDGPPVTSALPNPPSL